MNKNIILGIVVILTIGGIFLLESRKTERVSSEDLEEASAIDIGLNNDEEKSEEVSESMAIQDREERIKEKSEKYEVAKEITTPDGFINTDSITIAENIGKKVILVDFWTYSCINCQRTLPFLNSWHEKYADEGLLILGLHTPEFEFEKDFTNVQSAVDRFQVEYPVILDNDFSTWTSYRNRYWPRKYLIDIDGFITYDHIGEGAYDVTEEKIVELLNERKKVLAEGGAVTVNTKEPEGIDEVEFGEVRTPETYLGYERVEFLANLPDPNCGNVPCQYVLPEDTALNTFNLGGTWNIGPESARLESNEGVISIRFRANKVNLVAEGVGDGVSAEIFLDGKLISSGQSGEHVQNGIVNFGEAKLYNLIDLRGEYEEHLLEIKAKEKGLSAFAFTFG